MAYRGFGKTVSDACRTCQAVLLRLWEGREDLGLCACEVVVEWAWRLFHGGERLPAPIQQRPDHSENIQGQESFTEIPISLFAKIAESIDNGEVFEGMERQWFQTSITRNQA